MQRLTAVLAMMLVLGLTQTDIEGQKKKPTIVSVQATFDDEVILDETLPPVPVPVPAGILGDLMAYPGTVNLDGGFNLVLGNWPVDFAPGVFGFADPASLAPSSNGINFSMGTHNVGKVLPERDMAGQAGLTWTDAVTGKSYRLQYGDAYDDDIHYAHIRCTLVDQGGCKIWVISSLVTSAPTGEFTNRNTGPRARLTVNSGHGARGFTNLGTLEVPFSLTVVRQP